MITLEQAKANIGNRVTYTCAGSQDKEYGVITSVNSKFVFVRYGSDINSKATSPEDLTLG